VTGVGEAVRPPARDGDPLYVVVARTLRGEIVNGAFPVGAQLPTEDALSTRFAVSRHTGREALRRLRDEGLVSSRRGAGTTVAAPRGGDLHVLHAMTVGDLVAFARGTRLRIDDVRLATVSARTAARVGIAAGEEWLMVRGARCHGEGQPPLCLTDYFIHRRFAAIGRLLPSRDGPVFPLIEDLFAVRIVEVEQEIGASALPAETAVALGVDPGSTALEVRRTYRLDGGTIAQVTVNTHPATRYRHSMTMRRAAS
jgi:DNA-binding GntR family transcriptional regulator